MIKMEIRKVKKEILIENQNNLIKNLRYNVKFDNNTQYSITADLSEIFYKDDIEFVRMQTVFTKFIDEKNLSLIISLTTQFIIIQIIIQNFQIMLK